MNLAAVIGASYGDEGKGHVVASLASSETLVVRHSGGAQAGHTVVDSGGRRHVFHHFGSGTLKGARTFLSQYFTVNPMVFVDEWEALKQLGTEPFPHIDTACAITTPWDILLNQAVEKSRGDKRHGSCGLGLWETEVRQQGQYRFSYLDLISLSPGMVWDRLNRIRKEYVPARMKRLRITELAAHEETGLIDHFMRDLDFLKNHSVPRTWCPEMFSREKDIIFEGSQGLGLDPENPDAGPHVTTSYPGLPNVGLLLEQGHSRDSLSVYYVTRPYFTRHGAGPLENELTHKPYIGVEDPTNVENEWQGALRFGWFDVPSFIERISNDRYCVTPLDIFPTIVFTCIDQCDDEVKWVDENGLHTTTLGGLIDRIRKTIGFHVEFMTGTGPGSSLHTL
jgi:adenylosuccinate synthase